ncbi:MAG: SLC13 family permease [Candidatus Berkiella sp.]
MYQQVILLAILLTTLSLFIWSSWRYDIVALFALVLALLTGIVPFEQAFSGFSNSAVVTVACVMILTGAITQSGILNYFTAKIESLSKNDMLQIGFFTTISAALSAFMNNVGALGLMMPIAIHAFTKSGKSPSIILMPIAFSSVLGGLITAIGTPPNLLISQYRESVLGSPYHMFDFSPVGLIVAFIGVLFISLIGWRLVPVRKASDNAEDLFQIHDYMTEVIIPKDSPFDKMTIKDFFEKLKIDFDLVAIIHRGTKTFMYKKSDIICSNDILIIASSHDNLEKLLDATKFTLSGEKPISTKELGNNEIMTMEAVVPPGAYVQGQSSAMLKLRTRYKINLLALSRKGISFRQKLHDIRFLPGDVVLLQGPVETFREIIVDLGFLPLAERDIKIGLSQKKLLPLLVFIASVIVAALQILPISVSFLTAVLTLIILKAIPVYNIYRSIDWSVLLLLAAIIPVGGAIETTGTADLISNAFVGISGHYSPLIALTAILMITMTLSDLMNNAATAIIMAPIAFKIAEASSVNPDPFLMAVAVGASCSFLTPVAHQNNTMVMGPGGYQFFDYARLGLPLELLVIIFGIPAILWFWPL